MAKKGTPLPESQNGKNIFNGPVRIGRDFIGGDQYNFPAPANKDEFITQLQQIQSVLAEIQKRSDLAPVKAAEVKEAHDDIEKAIVQAQQPLPVAKKIKSTLDYTKDVMESLDSGIKTAMGLGATIALLGTLAANALHIFGM